MKCVETRGVRRRIDGPLSVRARQVSSPVSPSARRRSRGALLRSSRPTRHTAHEQRGHTRGRSPGPGTWRRCASLLRHDGGAARLVHLQDGRTGPNPCLGTARRAAIPNSLRVGWAVGGCQPRGCSPSYHDARKPLTTLPEQIAWHIDGVSYTSSSLDWRVVKVNDNHGERVGSASHGVSRGRVSHPPPSPLSPFRHRVGV